MTTQTTLPIPPQLIAYLRRSTNPALHALADALETGEVTITIKES